jgi:hypothetical protein
MQILGCERDAKIHLYSLYLGNYLIDGIVPISNDEDIVEMIKATNQDKTLVLFFWGTSRGQATEI